MRGQVACSRPHFRYTLAAMPMEEVTATTPLLVGRARELDLLEGQLAAAAEGRAGVAFISGEPGIGKTCLLDALAVRAARGGATVLRGGASEAEGMPPYLPFLEALGAHIRAADPEVLRVQAGPRAVPPATNLPELAPRLGAPPPGSPPPPE